MKESRFIELLNLYIDQQIPPEDAARLEEEILANPRRRRTYEQYCRMHRACTLVFASARTDPAATETRRAAGVVDFEPASRRSLWKYLAAGSAAAACLAFVAVQVLVRPGRPLPADSLVVLPASARPAPLKASGSWRMDATMTPAAFSPNAPLTAASFATVNVATRPAADPLRPSVEEFVFDQAPAGPGSSATFRNRPPADGETEMTAFQFQR